MLLFICEDSKSDCMRLMNHLNTYAKKNCFTFTTKSFSSGEALLAALDTANEVPVLIFLDIYLEKQSGIEVARSIRARGISSQIIFTTSSCEYAMDSYEVEALYYLQKPYTHEDFSKAMKRCTPLFEADSLQYTIRIRGKSLSLFHKDILYFETGKHSVLVHTTKENHSFVYTLSQVAQDLSQLDYFVSCGRSYVINLNHVAGFKEHDLVMTDQTIIPIPVREREHIKELVQKWKEKR